MNSSDGIRLSVKIRDEYSHVKELPAALISQQSAPDNVSSAINITQPTTTTTATTATTTTTAITTIAATKTTTPITASGSLIRRKCGEDKMVKCWDLEQNKVIRHYHGHLSGVYSLSLHPTLDVLVTAGRDASAR
ncbi:3043_t:CDS:2, partial [Entrophospora sp. SA101]